MKQLAELKTNRGIRDRMSRMHHALNLVEAGLAGKPATLDMVDGESIENLLGLVGIQLLSKTALTKRGHVLRKGAKPVMMRYFGSPIQKYAGLYIFGVQTKPSCEQQSKPTSKTS